MQAVPGERSLALQGALDESLSSGTSAGSHGATFQKENASMASLFDSQLIPFRSSFVQGPLITLQFCRGQKGDGGSRATKGQGYRRVIFYFFFFMTTDLCEVITPPCLKGLGCLILIDLTGEVSCSVHGGLNTESRKSQIGWGKKIAAYLFLQCIGWHQG